MRIYISLFFIFFVFVESLHASVSLEKSQMAKDLHAIIKTRTILDNTTSKTPKFINLSRKYLKELDSFGKKYITPLGVFSLRPTVDRTLSYKLSIQKYTLSCEISALQIILGGLGIQLSEDDIFASLPIGAYAYTSGGIWGDPDKEFVGFYTGSQAKKTGYGIYEKPLADFAKMYGTKTEIINSVGASNTYNSHNHLVKLLKTLDNPNSHVLLWGDWCTNPVFEDGILSTGGKWVITFFPLPGINKCSRKSVDRIFEWKTPENKIIRGLVGEHAFVLLGYVGNINHPTHIIVWDTFTGRHIYPYGEWMRKWSLMQHRSLIITKGL